MKRLVSLTVLAFLFTARVAHATASTATISGTLLNVDSSACAHCTITFSPSTTPQVINSTSVNIRPVSTTTNSTGVMTSVTLYQGAAMQVTVQDLLGNSSAPVAVSVAYSSTETLAQLLGGVQVVSGTVGGDLCGTLPNPTVCDFHLTQAANGGGFAITNLGGLTSTGPLSLTGNGSTTTGNDQISKTSVNGTINVAASPYGAKCDGASVADIVSTVSSNTITSATAPWTAADVGKTIRVYGAGAATYLFDTVSTTVNTSTALTLNVAPDYSAAGNGVFSFVSHGVTVTNSHGTWNAGSKTLSTSDAIFPSSGTISNATNATPIVITTNNAPPDQSSVTITGVLGNLAANGTFTATRLSSTSFSIPPAGTGAYTSGGTWTNTPAMSDGGTWPILLTAAKAGSITSTITAFNSTSSIVFAGTSAALSKTAKIAVWGTNDTSAFNNAFLSFVNNNVGSTVVGHVIVPPGVCMVGNLKIYGAIDFQGQGAGGKVYLSSNGNVEPVTSGLLYIGSSPAALTLTAATNSATGQATFTTSTAHGLESGQTVEISGVTPTNYNSPFNGGWTVLTTPTTTTFTAGITPDATGIAAASGFGTAQPRVPFIEMEPLDTTVFPPSDPGPQYNAQVRDMYMVGNSTDYPSHMVLWNGGSSASRFLTVDHVQMGEFPGSFSDTTDPDPYGQTTDSIGYVGSDASPARVVSTNMKSYRRYCINRSSNNSFSTFSMEASQCKPDNTYGAAGIYVTGIENTVADSALVSIPGYAFTLADAGEVLALDDSVEFWGGIVNFIQNSTLNHRFHAIGGDYQLCNLSNPTDGIEVLSSITGPSEIQFDGSHFFACTSGANLYTGPAFTWSYQGGASTHEIINLDHIFASGIHRPLTTTFAGVIPTSNQSDDVLFTGSYTDGVATNTLVGPWQNWLNSTVSTIDFTRFDLASSVTNATAVNWNISQSAPLVAGDVLSKSHSVGQTTVACLPGMDTTIKYNSGTCASVSPTVTVGGYWRLADASGNITDSSGNANTGVKSGAGGTYQQTGLTQDDSNTALVLAAGGPLYTVASAASLPSNNVFTVCWSSKKTTAGVLQTIIEQKTGGFHIQYGNTDLLTLWQASAANNIAVSSVAYPSTTTAYRNCVTHDATPNTNIYVNGQNVTTRGANYTDNIAPADATLYIGANAVDASPFIGTLDEIAVYKATLTPAQVLADYNEWASLKYGTLMYATDGLIAAAGTHPVANGSTGAAAEYVLLGWTNMGF